MDIFQKTRMLAEDYGRVCDSEVLVKIDLGTRILQIKTWLSVIPTR